MFSIGMRVVRIGTGGLVKPGVKGVVTQLGADFIGIDWDDRNDNPHKYRGGDIPSMIEVQKPRDLNRAIDRYQSACAAFEQAQEALERAKQAVADARIDIGRALENEP